MSPRTQPTIRPSPVTDRYLKAVDYVDDPSRPSLISPTQSSSHWNKEEKEETHLSFSGTASMSSSSRTPTPVRGSGRSPWQSKSISHSPKSMSNSTSTTRDASTDSSRSPRLIRLFPETSPAPGGAGVVEGKSTSNLLRSSRTTDTRSPRGKRQSDVNVREPMPRPITPSRASGEAESWRRKLEGTSHGMKRSPIRSAGVVADASWIKKKAPSRQMGQQTQQHTRSPHQLTDVGKPQPLTEEKLRARAQPFFRAHPSAAATEVMMNLSSQRTQTNPKSEVSGAPSESAAPTELMMNLSSQRIQSDQKSDFTGAPTEVMTNRAMDLNRRPHSRDDIDERIDYALQQGKRKRQGGAMPVQSTTFGFPDRAYRDTTSHLSYGNEHTQNHAVVPPAQGGRLGRHVDTGVENVVTCDGSFQSKSLTSSVGVETGGRSIERPPVALQRVLEFSPRGSETLGRGSRNDRERFLVRGVAPAEELIPVAAPMHAKESAPDIVPTVSIEEEMLNDNPFMVRYPLREPANHLRQHPQTLSPASSGWTPVALSSGGLDPDDFQLGRVRHSRDTGVQPLFSPSRVNSDVMDMMEFGPPMINRKALLDDEMNSIANSSPKTNDGNKKASTELKNLMQVDFIDSVPTHLASSSFSYAHLRRQRQAAKESQVNHDLFPGEGTLTLVEKGADCFGRSLQPNGVVPTTVLEPKQSRPMVVRESSLTQASLVRNRIHMLNSKDKIGHGQAISKDKVCCEELSTDVQKLGDSHVSQVRGREAAVIAVVPVEVSRLPSGTKSPSKVRAWDSRLSEAKSGTSSSSGEKRLPSKQEEGSNIHGHNPLIRLADRYLSSITPAIEQADHTPLRRNVSESNKRGALPLTNRLEEESGERRTSPRRSFQPQGVNNIDSAPSPVVVSVSKMKSLFEPSQGNNGDMLEDGELSDDNVSVRSIRSIFEAEKKTEEPEDTEVSKIRSLFEQQGPSQSGQRKGSVKRPLTKSPTGANAVYRYGGKPANTQAAKGQVQKIHIGDALPHQHMAATPLSSRTLSSGQAAISEEKRRSASLADEDGLVSKQRLSSRPLTIADRIDAMKLERGYSVKKKEKTPFYDSLPVVTPIKSPQPLGIAPRTYNSVFAENSTKQKEPVGNHHDHPLPTSTRMPNRDLVRPLALAYRPNSAPTKKEVEPVPIHPNARNAPIGSNLDTGNSMTRFRQSSSQALVPDNPALNRWGVAPAGNQEVYKPERQGHRSSTLQGVMGKKAINEGPRYLDPSYRTDSEGYDDGVTLDLSIGDVSQLTNPTCLRSKGGSFEGTSSRASNADGVEQEGRGPSEASSSQTSEAAAPLIALAMRARYTNSSDDYGNFAQKSFGERLAPGTQSKWVPLTAPIEEDEGGGTDRNTDSSDPAWDLRNIKARFAQRQAEREHTAARKKTPERKSVGSGPKVWDQSELDGWEPFKTEQFQANFGNDTLQKDVVRNGRAQMEPRLVEKKSRKGPVDPPPTVPTKAKVGGARDASPTAARVKKSAPKTKTESPAPKTPYSQQAALMSKLRSLKEARIRRNTTFVRKVTAARSNRPGGIGTSRPPSGYSSSRQGTNVLSRRQSPTHYSEMRSRSNPEEEEHSISTMSSTKFGGEKFDGCLDLD